MVTVIIAAHGHLAPALIDSAAMIMGEQDGVVPVTFDPSEGPDDLLAKYEAAAEGETLLLVDFFAWQQARGLHIKERCSDDDELDH